MTPPATRKGGLRAQAARFHALINRGLRAVRGRKAMEEAALSREIICTEQTVFPPTFHDEENLALVTASHPQTSLAAERARIAGFRSEGELTIRYRFRNVLATPFGFFPLGDSQALSGRTSLRQLLTDRVVEYNEGVYAPSTYANLYFGHWVHDALPTSRLAEEGMPVYLPVTAAWPHTGQYVEALGLPHIGAELVFFREMTAYYDLGVNSSRAARLRQIHGMIQARAPESGASGLYTFRGDTGQLRRIVDEEALGEALAARGFALARPHDPLQRIWDIGGRAPIEVSLEGSQQAHSLFAVREGGLHVCINPADRFGNIYALLAPALGCRYATVVAERREDGYHVDHDVLLRVIDRAWNEMERQR